MRNRFMVFMCASAIVASAVLISGCPAKEQGGEAPAAAPGSLLDAVKARGVVRAGLRYENPPHGFIDRDGNWVGFDVDIAGEIARRLSVRLEKVRVTGTSRIPLLISGKIDFAAATMTHKRARDEAIDFTITYFFDGQKIMARKGEFKELKDFVGHSISTVQGTTSEKNVRELLKRLGDPEPKILSFQGHPQAFLALKQGKVDGYTTDSTIMLGVAKGDPDVELVGEFFSDEPYGIGVRENDSDWRDALNFLLQDMWRDGTYMKIYNTWLGPDTDFPFPLEDELEDWP